MHGVPWLLTTTTRAASDVLRTGLAGVCCRNKTTRDVRAVSKRSSSQTRSRPSHFVHYNCFLSAVPQTQLFIKAYAKALEVIPRQLCNNAGFDATDVLNQLRNKHAQADGSGKVGCWVSWRSPTQASVLEVNPLIDCCEGERSGWELEHAWGAHLGTSAWARAGVEQWF